jgi:hypothetical protein
MEGGTGRLKKGDRKGFRDFVRGGGGQDGSKRVTGKDFVDKKTKFHVGGGGGVGGKLVRLLKNGVKSKVR